jgi:outer membrane usher protein
VPGGTASNSSGIVTLQPTAHMHIVTASYSVQAYNMSFYATGFHDLVRGGGTGVLIGMTIPFGQRSSVGVSAGSGSTEGYQQMQVQQSVQNPGDWGYQAYAGTSSPAHSFADVQYKSPWALVSAGVDRIGAQNTERAEVQGAVSFADGGVYASNQINDSFAVVDTDGAPGVTVLRENQKVGKTDSSGRLLVPDLRSFDVNRLTIDPTDVSVDSTVDTATREVRPQYRSGVVVPFHVRVSHGALLRLVDKAGKPVPLGSVATLQATGVGVPVGYGGEAYVQDLGAHNTVNVTGPKGSRCAVAFDFTAKPNDIPTIGPLTCQENGS